jgi:hypothetical protein
VFECRRHSIDFRILDSHSFSGQAPLSNRTAHLFGDFPGSCRVEFKIFGNFHCKIERRRAVVLIDSRSQDARLDVDQYGIEIVRRREPPAVRPFV